MLRLRGRGRGNEHAWPASTFHQLEYILAPPAIVRAQSAQNRQSSETCEWLK